jgi:hypothetical protein
LIVGAAQGLLKDGPRLCRGPRWPRNGETAPFGAGKFESGIGAPALMARITNVQSVECVAPR